MEFLWKLVFLPAITFRVGGGRKMKKIILVAVTFAVSLFGFTGCYDAIYQSIRNEIELTTQKMPGFINNIARFNAGEGAEEQQFLFLTNGVIQYKNAKDEEHGKWTALSGNGLPDSVHYVFEKTEFEGVYFSKIIADKDYVYALGFEPEYDTDNSRNVPVNLKVYYTKPTLADGKLEMTWKEITDLSEKMNGYQNEIDKIDDDNYGMAISCHLFGTNSVNPDHRVAFLRVGGGSPYIGNTRNETSSLYKLSGETAEPVAAITSGEGDNADSGDFIYSEFDLDTLSVVYFGGKYHFMNYLNVETNEGTTGSDGTGRAEPTFVYFGDYGDNLYYFSVDSYNAATDEYKKMFKYPRASYRLTDEKKKTVTEPTALLSEKGEKAGYLKGVSDKTVICIAVTSDSLILGTGANRSYNASASSGSGAVQIKIDSETGKPTGTGSFSTNADKVMYSPYTVRALLAVDPSKTETATSIYSTVDYIYTATSAGTNSTNRGLWAYYPAKGEWNRE